MRKRLGTKNAAQKSGPKQKLKFPKGGKAKKGKKAGWVIAVLFLSYWLMFWPHLYWSVENMFTVFI